LCFFANIAVEIENQNPLVDKSPDLAPHFNPVIFLYMNDTPLTPINTEKALNQLQTKHSLGPLSYF
jgi:hypothetical protein